MLRILNKVLVITLFSFAYTCFAQTLVFISFSMPDNSIKQWAEQAKSIGAPLIVRGLVNHSIQATVLKLQAIDPSHTLRIVLNPRLFKKYAITRVPAVVVEYDEGKYDALYGDVTLDFALSKIKHLSHASTTRRNAHND